MVFKAVAGVRRGYKGAGVIWKDIKTYREKQTNVLDVTNRIKAFYKNRIVLNSNWRKFRHRQARVVLYVRGRGVVKLTFNAINTNNINWFTLSKFDRRTSPWSDLAKVQKVQFFNIMNKGACHGSRLPKCRTFFINRSYGGCPNDLGWMVLGGRTCPWETKHRKYVPAILYSKTKKFVNWNDKSGSVGEADVMAVFVR